MKGTLQTMRLRYEWGLVALLWFVCACNYADRQAIASVFPQLKTQMGLSTLQLGIVASSFMWIYAVSGPFAGWVSDRISPRAVVIGALALWSLVTAGTGLSHVFAQLVFFRTLGGFGEAFYFPAAMALIGAYHTAATRSRAMAIHQSSVYAGTIAGGALSAQIAERHGWQTSFFAFGGFGLLLALVLLRLLRKPRHHAYPASQRTGGFVHDVAGVLRNAQAVGSIAVFMGANFVAVVFLTWLPTFLGSKFHMSLGEAGLKSTVYLQVASVIGVLVGGFLGDRAATARPGGRQRVQSIGLLSGVPFLVLTGWSSTFPGLVFGLLGFGFCKGLYDGNMWASLYDVVAAEQRGVAVGTMNSLGWLGAGAAPIAVALLAGRFGLSACLSATSLIYAAAACIIWSVSEATDS